MGELERIYWNKVDENNIIADKTKENLLNEQWTKITQDENEKVDNLICEIISFYREEAFKCGFRTAVSLLVGDR